VTPRRSACGWLALLLLAAACGKGGGGTRTRDRDGAPVVVVERRSTGGRLLADEREPNDADDKANPIELGGGVRGNLDGETDVDVYALHLAARTVLDARLSGSGVDLVLELHARDRLLAHSDRGPAGTVEGFPDFPLDPGDYLLVVREYVKPAPTGKKAKKEPPRQPRTGASPPYELLVAAAPAPQRGREVEPNTEIAAAGELGLGEEGLGWLGWSDDVDLWRIDVTGLGEGYALDFDVAIPEGAQATLALLDDNSDPLLERRGDRGESIAVRGLVPRPGNEHYYVQLTTRRSNPEEPYSVRATTRLRDLDEEAEPNDKAAAAGRLREDSRETGGTRRGWLGAGDSDYWTLPAGPAGSLSLSVTPPEGVDVKLAVTAGGSKVEANAGKRGATEQLTGVAVAERTPVTVVVSGSGSSAEPYLLRWSFGEPVYDPYRDPAAPE